ncbi:MAG: hypothetical protein IJU54_01210, partial [Alphaproteobacteria bacterium]|nr:hypothetical protein [Alphaproteobacteria bacterium]
MNFFNLKKYCLLSLAGLMVVGGFESSQATTNKNEEVTYQIFNGQDKSNVSISNCEKFINGAKTIITGVVSEKYKQDTNTLANILAEAFRLSDIETSVLSDPKLLIANCLKQESFSLQDENKESELRLVNSMFNIVKLINVLKLDFNEYNINNKLLITLGMISANCNLDLLISECKTLFSNNISSNKFRPFDTFMQLLYNNSFDHTISANDFISDFASLYQTTNNKFSMDNFFKIRMNGKIIATSNENISSRDIADVDSLVNSTKPGTLNQLLNSLHVNFAMTDSEYMSLCGNAIMLDYYKDVVQQIINDQMDRTKSNDKPQIFKSVGDISNFFIDSIKKYHQGSEGVEEQNELQGQLNAQNNLLKTKLNNLTNPRFGIPGLNNNNQYGMNQPLIKTNLGTNNLNGLPDNNVSQNEIQVEDNNGEIINRYGNKDDKYPKETKLGPIHEDLRKKFALIPDILEHNNLEITGVSTKNGKFMSPSKIEQMHMSFVKWQTSDGNSKKEQEDIGKAC